MSQAHPAPFTGETQPPGGTPWLVPAQEASKLEHLQIYDTGLTAPQASRTAGPAPDSSLGAHRTARRRLPDRGVSATPDCPLHRNIYIYFHTPLWNYQEPAPLPLPRLGRRCRGLSLARGSQTGRAWGPGPLLVLRGPLATHGSLIFAPACLSLSWAGEEGGKLCWE